MSQLYENGQIILEVIAGPMFSGKTEELIRRIRRVSYAKMNALVFKPKIDTRHQEHEVVSHSLSKIPSISVKDVSQMRAYLSDFKDKLHVIGLDEAQFFDSSIVDFCEELITKNIKVIAAGLAEDYLGNPFGSMPFLLARADTIIKLWAVCMICGAPASKSQRVYKAGQKSSDSQIVIGATDCYEARCRGCYKKEVVEILD